MLQKVINLILLFKFCQKSTTFPAYRYLYLHFSFGADFCIFYFFKATHVASAYLHVLKFLQKCTFYNFRKLLIQTIQCFTFFFSRFQFYRSIHCIWTFKVWKCTLHFSEKRFSCSVFYLLSRKKKLLQAASFTDVRCFKWATVYCTWR